MQNGDTIKGLWNLVRSSTHEGKHLIAESRIIEILDALLESQDLALMELIPILLSLAAQSGFSMNLKTLFDKYGSDSQQSEILQKSLLLTLSLLEEEGFALPGGSRKQKKLLEGRWGDLASFDALELGNGISLQIDRLREVFKQYTHQPPGVQATSADEAHEPFTASSKQLHRHLRLLFSPRQKDLILKKLEGVSLSKTEREYYSRIVKKKLAALADKSLQELASRLVGT